MALPSKLQAIFDKPDSEEIKNLSPDEFKIFSQHVFERAGYIVVESSQDEADFELRNNKTPNENRPIGFVTLSSGVEYVGRDPVVALNNLPGFGSIERFFVSSDSFEAAAKAAISEARLTHLLDNARLRRFINYVRGTRHPDSQNPPFSPTQLFENEPVK